MIYIYIGIYLLGPLKATPLSTVAHNWVFRQVDQSMGALYPDEGSSNIEVHDNVITGMSEKGTCYGAETLFFGRFSAVLHSKTRTSAKTGSGQTHVGRVD